MNLFISFQLCFQNRLSQSFFLQSVFVKKKQFNYISIQKQ
ncbi:hypothetical protein pb186bvf_005618 [Paramecium bursaria]